MVYVSQISLEDNIFSVASVLLPHYGDTQAKPMTSHLGHFRTSMFRTVHSRRTDYIQFELRLPNFCFADRRDSASIATFLLSKITCYFKYSPQNRIFHWTWQNLQWIQHKPRYSYCTVREIIHTQILINSFDIRKYFQKVPAHTGINSQFSIKIKINKWPTKQEEKPKFFEFLYPYQKYKKWYLWK